MFLEIKSDPAELKEVRKQLDEFCAKNLKDIDIFKIKLSVDEALQNIIRHAYKMDKDKKIKIEFDKDSKDNLRIRLRDYGIQTPIDKIKSRELDDIRPGGLGVHFIKSSTKEMNYEHQEDGGTLLTLVFWLFFFY